MTFDSTDTHVTGCTFHIFSSDELDAIDRALCVLEAPADDGLPDGPVEPAELHTRSRAVFEHASPVDAIVLVSAPRAAVTAREGQRRRRSRRPWTQPPLFDAGHARVSPADLATWDRAMDGAPLAVRIAWSSVREWVLLNQYPAIQSAEGGER